MKRLLALLLVVVGTLPLNAQLSASIRVAAPPLKVLTCELLLSPHLRGSASHHHVLRTVLDAEGKVDALVPSDLTPPGTNIFEGLHSGPIEAIPIPQAALIRNGLRKIASHVIRSSQDAEYVAFAIRGREAIAVALQDMERRKSTLGPLYQKLLKSANSGWEKLMPLVTNWMYPTLVVVSGTEWLRTGNTLAGFFLGISTFYTLSTFIYHFEFPADRLDHSFSEMKSVLQSAASGTLASDHFFISSSELSLPGRFHRMLMSGVENEKARLRAARRYGHRSSGPVSLEAYVPFSHTADFMSTQLDVLITTDSKTDEPVWLVAYRARPQVADESTDASP